MTKGILVERRKSIALSLGCDTKNVYHEEMEDWFNGILSKVEIVGKCLKFLISIDFFFVKNIS